jgi:hypothetical protein
MAKLAGVVRVSANGELLETLPEAKLMLGGEENETVSGHRVYGARGKIVPSKLSITLVWKNGSPIETLRNMRDGTAVFEADIGEAYTVDGLNPTTTPEITGGSGEVTMEFEGNPAKKL